jgi:hypothetical protein
MATSRIGRRLLVLLALLGSLAPAPGRAQTCGGIEDGGSRSSKNISLDACRIWGPPND